LLRVERRQRCERVIEVAQIDRALLGRIHGLVERDAHRGIAPLRRPARARVVDQDAPHETRRDREKMRAVLPLDAGLPCDPQIRFVHERGRVQRRCVGLRTKPAARELLQLRIDGVHEIRLRALVSRVPSAQERGDVPPIAHAE
jgi:hypothetical protein